MHLLVLSQIHLRTNCIIQTTRYNKRFLLTQSKAFFISINAICVGNFLVFLCLIIGESTKTWSSQDLLQQNPLCSSANKLLSSAHLLILTFKSELNSL